MQIRRSSSLSLGGSLTLYADSKNIILVSYPAQLLNDTTTPSVVGSPVVGTVSSTSATITWITDEFTTSSVDYGTTAGNYPESQSDGLYVTDHSVTLTGLAANTTYYLRVGGTDQAGNSYQSAELSFTVDNQPVATPTATSTPIPGSGWQLYLPTVQR